MLLALVTWIYCLCGMPPHLKTLITQFPSTSFHLSHPLPKDDIAVENSSCNVMFERGVDRPSYRMSRWKIRLSNVYQDEYTEKTISTVKSIYFSFKQKSGVRFITNLNILCSRFPFITNLN